MERKSLVFRPRARSSSIVSDKPTIQPGARRHQRGAKRHWDCFRVGDDTLGIPSRSSSPAIEFLPRAAGSEGLPPTVGERPRRDSSKSKGHSCAERSSNPADKGPLAQTLALWGLRFPRMSGISFRSLTRELRCGRSPSRRETADVKTNGLRQLPPAPCAASTGRST